MPRDSKAKLPPMTEEQLDAHVQSRRENRIYGGKAARQSEWREQNDAQLSKILDISLSGLNNVANQREKISLYDTESVKQITQLYWEKCREHSVIPMLIDIAAALGYTRQGVYRFVHEKPEHPTSAWLMFLKDNINAIVYRSSMTGATAPIPSIFFLKSQGGCREDVDDMPNTIQDNQEDAETIIEKYADLPDV